MEDKNKTKQNQQCLMLKSGDEFVVNPEISPIQRMMNLFVMQLGKFNPEAKNVLTSKCIKIPQNKKQHSIMRVQGHSIEKQPNHPMFAPHLIVSSFPINSTTKKRCQDICEEHKQKCSCIKPSSSHPRNIIYTFNIHSIKGYHIHLNTIGSAVSLNKFNVFNTQLIAKPGDHRFKLLPAPRKNEKDASYHFRHTKHILIRPVQDKFINARFSVHTNSKPLNVNMSVVSLHQNMLTHKPKSVSCIMSKHNYHCSFNVYSKYDHHIIIQNNGKKTENFTLRFHTNNGMSHPESITVPNGFRHHHHHHYYAAVFIVALLTLLAVFGFVMLIFAILDHFKKDFEESNTSNVDADQSNTEDDSQENSAYHYKLFNRSNDGIDE